MVGRGRLAGANQPSRCCCRRQLPICQSGAGSRVCKPSSPGCPPPPHTHTSVSLTHPHAPPSVPPPFPYQVAKTLNEKVSQFLQVTLDICAYAGKGDVLKVR